MATTQSGWDAGSARSTRDHERETVASDRVGNALLAIARASIASGLGREAPPATSDDPRLRETGATFVTLRRVSTGRVHGCMGSLAATRPVAADVRANALAAAFLDRRSPPLTAPQYDDLSVEVSLLGAGETLAAGGEREAIARLRRGDGYILTWGPMHGLLLPQAWSRCDGPGSFLRALRIEAGLPPDFWAEGVRLHGFAVTSWRDAPGARPDPSR